MKCPVCPDATLAMMDRQGVEIDYCPQCRGVWLDRGELDKLMELSGSQKPAPSAAAAQRPDFVDSDSYGSRSGYGVNGRPGSHGYQPQRKKSWLNEIFD